VGDDDAVAARGAAAVLAIAIVPRPVVAALGVGGGRRQRDDGARAESEKVSP